MSSSWNTEMTTMSNSLWRFRLLNQDPLRNHVPRGILAKGWKWRMGFVWESNWKDNQWKPTDENSRNSNSISSKGDLHSIESSITVETRIANLLRRLEVLETKEPVLVNQVSPNQFSTPGCTYYQAMNYVFEECPMFQAQQQFSEPINATFLRPSNNSYAQTYNPG